MADVNVLKDFFADQRGKQLLALATDASTTEEERRTAAMAFCAWVSKKNLLEVAEACATGFMDCIVWIKANRHFLNRHGAKVPFDL